LTNPKQPKHDYFQILDMGIFGFKPKKDEVLDHWISFADGFSLSPQEFYATGKKELDARKIPSMEMPVKKVV
jgi:hypothetical protein